LAGLWRGENELPRLAFAETDVWFADPVPGVSPHLRIPYPSIAQVTEVDLQHGGEIVLRRKYEATVIEAKHRMVRDERHKLVYVPTSTHLYWLLYDTVEDPDEICDIADHHHDVAERLKAELWKWMLDDPTVTRLGDRLVSRPEFFQDATSPATSVSLTVD
jgi:hypothetical protein